MTTTTYKTIADAEAAGFRRANRKTDKDTSGRKSFGYSFSDGKRKTVNVYLTGERNKLGTMGCIIPMYPPK